jgi:hypothetical protein
MTFIIFNKRGRDGGAHDGAHERALHTRKVAVGRCVPSGHHTMRAAEHEGWRGWRDWPRRRHVACSDVWEVGQWL